MNQPIRRAGVIGAGVMGSGIAAHLANAGVEVILLDIVPPNLQASTDAQKNDRTARNQFAAGGLDKAIKSRPAAFFHKGNARLVSIGNTEDDLGKMESCDLVIEAVLERLDVKQALFTKLEAIVKPGTIIASNTSGLRIHDMVQGRGDTFKKNFLVMHFFNPVRYMKLLELVAGPETSKEALERIHRFGEDQLGKGIVYGKDTPNFVGNRIGVHAMMTTIHLMLEDDLTPEDVDNITGTPMGHPKSASFRTADLVGLDTFVHVASNCYTSLPEDEERKVFEVPAFIKAMVEKKLLGNKTKGGFYKKSKDDVQTFDPKTLEYRAKGGDEAIKSVSKKISKIEDPKARVKALVADTSKAGQFAWKVISRSLAYSARRLGEITDDPKAVDDAMKWGYNWELGPFETWDAIGFVEVRDRMKKDGIALPAWVEKMTSGFYSEKGREDGAVWDFKKNEYVGKKADPRYATLPMLRKGGSPVLKNDGAEAWDLGDGVLGFTMKTKANTIDPDVIALVSKAVEKAETDFRAMVIANEGENFCVGANVVLVAMAAAAGEWEQIRSMVRDLQAGMQRVRYSRVPVVAAPYGFTFGGGLELCLPCASVQGAAETYAGLVEFGVGLIPGGGGTLGLLWRALEAQPEGMTVNTYEVVTQVFKNIATANVATSFAEGQKLGYFRPTDGVSFDRARQVVEAKSRAIGLAESGYHAPIPRAYVLPGDSGIATLSMMVETMVATAMATEHEGKIARKLATVLCGGRGGGSREVTEAQVLELEAEAFVSLCGEENSQQRMQHMAQFNKVLRN